MKIPPTLQWLDHVVTTAHENLVRHPRVRETLYGRGVTDDQIRAFRLGYLERAPNEVGSGARSNEFVEWGSTRDRLTQVIVFPLTTTLGVIGGLQVRYVDRAKKGYGDFLVVREESVLFGLAQAMESMWLTRDVALVEGVFDHLAVQRHAPNVVATLTASVPESLVRILRRMVDRVWVVYDNDASGRRGAYEFSRGAGEEFDTRVVTVPPAVQVGTNRRAKDPSDLWELWGDDRVGQWWNAVQGDPL